MHPKLQKFFEQQEKLKKEEKDKYLINLGLFTESEKTCETFLDVPGEYKALCIWNAERKLYVYSITKAIEVSDEDYSKLLEIKPIKTTNSSLLTLENNTISINSSLHTIDNNTIYIANNTISIKNWITFLGVLTIIELVIGIIVGIILL